MRLPIIFSILAGLALSGVLFFSAQGLPAQTESAQTEIEVEQPAVAAADGFNLFALGVFGQFRVFNFDQSYTDQFGIAVPQPFRLALPINDALHLVSDGAPDNGAFARFTWAVGPDDDRRFVENVTVYAAEWAQTQNPDVRLDAIQAFIRDNVFAQATAGMGGGELAGWGRLEVNGLVAAQAMGTYTDPTWGPMLLRIVAYPNPGPGPSYFVMNHISLDMVPIVHLDQMRSSLGGQAVQSFGYLAQ